MRNRSHIHDANIPRPRHGHRYTNYKMSHCTMTVICIKQHISNIWSSVHEKGNSEAELKKSVAFKKIWCMRVNDLWHNSRNIWIC